MELHDRTVVEAASWRLASELVRRHPNATRLNRTHPGGGQYDVLQIDEADGPGCIMLNRNGTIQVHGRFDGGAEPAWQATEWVDYVAADPAGFLKRLEASAGLAAPASVPRANPATLTYRVLAAMASTAIKSVHPIEIQQGYIDTSGYGGGPNQVLDSFDIAPERLRARDDDMFREPGYRFWIPTQGDRPVAAIEQSAATAWFLNGTGPIDLMETYRSVGRSAVLVAARVLLSAGGGA